MLIRKHLSNIFGWKTKRKIVVFESDDWGSIRTYSKDAYHRMVSQGLDLNNSNFTMFDSLESNKDLEDLFQVLQIHKDSTDRHPVFTPMVIVANPDFRRIRESNFKEYHYESFLDTCKKYPERDRVPILWLDGIKKRLFVPQLHGREHLNIKKWLGLLQTGNKGIQIAFDNFSIGVNRFNNALIPNYLAAFDPKSDLDISDFHKIIEDANELFFEICKYSPQHFIASNSSEPKSLESTLSKIGVNYLTRYKFQKYPLGNDKYEYQFNWLGKRNKFNQLYLTRNIGFEPSDFNAIDVVQSCLNEIKIAFTYNKPAIISSHRVNYIGCIVQKNREMGLAQLDSLLKSIISLWPDVEFMTSVELGDLIASTKD